MCGEGGSRGECHDSVLWKDSTLEENAESRSSLSDDAPEGDLDLGLDEGGLMTSDKTGGAVIDLL